MDLWVVAAATGAGYIAKHWQSFSEEKDGSSGSYALDKLQPQSDSYSSLQHIQYQNWRLHKSSQNSICRNASFDRGEPDERLNTDLASGMSSTSGSGYGKGLGELAKSGDYTLLSLASVPPLLYDMESYEGINDQTDEKEFNDKPGETSSFSRFNRSKILKRRKPYGCKAKPVSSFESCRTARLNGEHAKLEEYVGSSLPTFSAQMVRPLLVTDGSRLISRSSTDFKAKIGPKRSTELQRRRPRPIFGKVRSRRMSSAFDRVSAKPYNSQGSPNGILFLLLGMVIGIISTVVANKREVDKLNELLKHSENLVQDLHDELEMKDSLSMKELHGDELNLPETNIPSFTKQELGASTEDDDRKAGFSESMNNIEAELEAELKILELNMASSLDRIPDFVEHDHDIMANVVMGELRLNTINGHYSDSSDSDRDASGASTNHIDTANYAVSPRELSLRLHEVIQSMLEARIVELETALAANQKRLSSMDLLSESESFSTQETRNSEDECNGVYTPLIMNLSGEDLSGYNVAYEAIRWTPKTPKTEDHDKNCRVDEFTDWNE